MNTSYRLIPLLLLSAGAGSARAQSLTADPATAEIANRATTALYDLDYDRARAEIRRLIADQPSNPLGYLGEAELLWWQADAEYGLFKDSKTLEALFEEDIARAVKLADGLLDSPDPIRKADGHFVAGMGLGLHGQAEVLRGRWMKAYSDGKKAIKHLKKCIKLDPGNQDVLLGLGIFDYQTARLPVLLKVPMFFVHRGDAKRGIAYIRQAMERGRFSREQAGTFLLSIYLKEGDMESALSLLKGLRRQFPGSSYFVFREAALLAESGDLKGSFRDAMELFERASADPAVLGRKQLSLFCALVGPQCLDETYASALVRWLDRALEEPEAAHYRALLYLYRGIARDVLGQRVDAVRDYSLSIGAPDVPPAHEYARRCLGSACDREETLRILKDLARSKN
ncbi:MAG: hypothetical protein HY922_15485 [Elusimicrobia bacterium]|nr:hypothetical protein [Elusimicrobiota bacterium]